MKLNYSILLVISLFSTLLLSTNYEIKQDGSGDFISIQAGIDVAIDQDAILVYPGTYYENIDFMGKKIVVSSLFIEEQDNSYIYNTIIDGGQNGSCVKFSGGEDNTSILSGFTLQHGSGTERFNINGSYAGGGIYCFDCTAVIENCIITNNSADAGGGIFSDANLSDGYSSPLLKNCTIKYNHAFNAFGGIGSGFYSRFDFDQNSPCNIYCNTASYANDFGGSFIDYNPTIAYIDTFTVLEPDNTFFCFHHGQDELHINHAKHEPINSDLYVSPSGDDNNSGLSNDDPLQRISTALIRVASDSLHHNTIHLASGTYSPSINNEKFPQNCRSYVSIIGEDVDSTILDVEGKHKILNSRDYERDYTLKNMTLVNSSNLPLEDQISLAQPRNVFIENIKIKNIIRNYSGYSIAAYTIGDTFLDSTSLYLKNISIDNCTGTSAGGFYAIEDCIFSNMEITNNTPIYDDEIYPSYGCFGIHVGGHHDYPDRYNYKFINCSFSENYLADDGWSSGASALYVCENTNVDIINCTFGDNESNINSSAALYLYDSDIDCNVVNTIFYGNLPRAIIIREPYQAGLPPINLNISHSLVEGGIDEILDLGTTNNINWLEGNIDEDPEWSYDDPFPYSLISSSPCIDAGTLNLPDGIELPEYDLAGYPRVYGDVVDMGAFEYQGVQTAFEDNVVSTSKASFSIYPNPFNPSTTVKLSLDKSSEVNISIFNIKGQKVITLTDRYYDYGEYNLLWNGIDQNDKRVSSGQYLVKLSINGTEKTIEKCILLK